MASLPRTLRPIVRLGPSPQALSLSSLQGRPFSSDSLPSRPSRSYYYTVDTHGQLFLSSTPHKNFTSSYKDPQFLDIFFKRLRSLPPPSSTSSPSSSPSSSDASSDMNEEDGYHWISECMGEKNFLRSESNTPLVFTSILPSSPSLSTSPALSNFDLILGGGTIRIPFDPSSLTISSEGHVLHALPPESSFAKKAALWGLLGGRVVTEGLGGKVREGLERGEGRFWWEGTSYELQEAE